MNVVFAIVQCSLLSCMFATAHASAVTVVFLMDLLAFIWRLPRPPLAFEDCLGLGGHSRQVVGERFVVHLPTLQT